MVRQSAEVVNQMVSVERVAAYGDLPSEAPIHKDKDAAHPDWPKHSSIEFKELTARYQKDFPAVLKGVTLSIKAGEKVGVVGRYVCLVILLSFSVCSSHQLISFAFQDWIWQEHTCSSSLSVTRSRGGFHFH